MSEQMISNKQADSIRQYADKPVVLVFVGYFLPGFKAGGIIRSVNNIVCNLSEEFEFMVVTRDRDLGDDEPYSGILLNKWQQVGNIKICYIPFQSIRVKDILKLIIDTPHDVLYLNSFFDSLTVKVLLSKKLNREVFKPVIVSTRGEFAWASLKQKYPKKIAFIQAAKLFGLYKNVVWCSSSEYEARDIARVMNIKLDTINIISDLTINKCSDLVLNQTLQFSPACEAIRLVFLSRISREKNLDYALNVLKKVNAKVVFDIYGPIENKTYWKECQKLICQMPANVKVNYLGIVNNSQVIHIFSCYDLFFFPTGGENYGHVIAESLIAGTPVLISTETPWRNLQAEGIGWDIDLAHLDSFVEIIERLAVLSDNERLKKRATIKVKITERLLDPVKLEKMRQFFKNICRVERIPG